MSRFVEWEGLVNARDLGGLPVRGGGSTASARVYRADNVAHLTRRGWSQVEAAGVTGVVDLRLAKDRSGEHSPAGIAVKRISLFGDGAPDWTLENDVRAAHDDVEALTRFYAHTLRLRGQQLAEIISAIADAAPGGLVVHCFVGKDRTGLVVALLLQLAGVPDDAIVEDYALSANRVASLVDTWIAQGHDEAERTYRARISGAPRDAMARTLELLDTQYGGATGYLTAAGVTDDTLDRAAARLLP